MILMILAVFLAVVATASAADVPEFIHVCKRNDPDLNACITESITHIGPYLAKGIPEFNIPAIEPLLLDELVAVRGSTLKLSVTGLNVYGCSNYVVSNLQVDLDHLSYTADVSHPHLYVEGDYHLDGKLLVLPISGSGPMRANFTDCTGSIRIQGELRKDAAGDEYLYCNTLDLKLSVGSGNIWIGNILGGDPTLGEVINTAINNNFLVFVGEIKPLIETALSEAIKDIANNIAKPFTWRQLIPDN